jgi:UPF0755 protein
MMKKLSLLLFAVVLVCAILFGSFVWDGFLISPGPDAEQVSLVVESGSGLSQISALLKEEDLIKSQKMFELYARFSGSSSQFQAGSFELSTGMSYAALTRALTQAEATEVTVTIPEGFTLAQVEETVRAALPHITEQTWKAAVGPNSPLKEAYPEILSSVPENQDLEGYLFPDTYRFADGASAETVAETMLLTLKRRLAEQGFELPEYGISERMTFHELITLASIIEREVRGPEDMRKVSDIFQTRLEIGMGLQADSTVNYITGGDSPSISLTDRDIQSPYNTYQVIGLPPGPISHPGIDAIIAVIDPTETDFLFFLTTPEGDVKYATTFNEHVANKNTYLR